MIVQCSTPCSRASHLLHLFKYGVMQLGFLRSHLSVPKKTDPSCSQNASLEWGDQGRVIKIFRFVCSYAYMMTLYTNSVFCIFVPFLKKRATTRNCFRTDILHANCNSTEYFTTPSNILRLKKKTTEVVKENPLKSNEK